MGSEGNMILQRLHLGFWKRGVWGSMIDAKNDLMAAFFELA